MSTLNTASFRDLVDNVTIIWNKSLDTLMTPARSSGLYQVGTWAEGEGDTRQYSMIDTQKFAKRKSEGGSASTAKVQQGYTKTSSPERFGTEIEITWEMRKYNKYKTVHDKLVSLAEHIPNRLDLDLSHRITFGTATSYVDQDGETVTISVGDGLALFSTAHTLRGSASTYRNRLANNPQFSKGALEGMEKLVVEESLTQLGEKQTAQYDIVYSTDDPNTVNTIRTHLQSTADISAQNEGVVNVYRSKYRHVVLPNLATDANGAPDSTKAKYWGIASSRQSSAFCDIVEENTLTAPTPNGNADDFSTDNWTYKSRGTRAIVIVDGSWIKFSSGDGTA
jgi:hypothetical protein